jgi:hypothetical protein
MTDIVERLRDKNDAAMVTRLEAADKIERLRMIIYTLLTTHKLAEKVMEDWDD